MARTAFTVLAVAAALAGGAPAAAQQREQRPLEQAAPPNRPATIAGCPADPVPFYPCTKEKIKTFNPPRTPDGKPNLQGYWNANRQAFDIEAHEPSFAYQGGPTLSVDPADGQVP